MSLKNLYQKKREIIGEIERLQSKLSPLNNISDEHKNVIKAEIHELEGELSKIERLIAEQEQIERSLSIIEIMEECELNPHSSPDSAREGINYNISWKFNLKTLKIYNKTNVLLLKTQYKNSEWEIEPLTQQVGQKKQTVAMLTEDDVSRFQQVLKQKQQAQQASTQSSDRQSIQPKSQGRRR